MEVSVTHRIGRPCCRRVDHVKDSHKAPFQAQVALAALVVVVAVVAVAMAAAMAMLDVEMAHMVGLSAGGARPQASYVYMVKLLHRTIPAAC